MAEAAAKLSLDGLVYVLANPPKTDDEVDAQLERLPPGECYGTTADGREWYLYRARKGARYASHPAPGIEVKSGAGALVAREHSTDPSVLDEAPAWLEDKDEDEWPAELDLNERTEEPTRIVLDISAGTAGAIFGDGGMGKSTIATHAAVCVALGRPLFGTPVARRKAFCVDGEDRKHVTLPKVRRVCAHEGVAIADLAGWLVMTDLVGMDAVLWRDGAPTAAFEQLRSRITKYGSEFLVIDGIADTYDGSEQDNEPKRFINALVGLVPPHGAVLLIGHVTKQIAAKPNTDAGYRGSAAWHNALRTRWYLRPRNGGGVVLENQKRNYGAASAPIEFDWDEKAGLFVGKVVGSPVQEDPTQRAAEQAAILRALDGATAQPGAFVPAAQRGPRNAYSVLSEQTEFPATLKASGAARNTSIRRFWACIHDLRANALIEDQFIARERRKRRRGIVLSQKGRRAIAQ